MSRSQTSKTDADAVAHLKERFKTLRTVRATWRLDGILVAAYGTTSDHEARNCCPGADAEFSAPRPGIRICAEFERAIRIELGLHPQSTARSSAFPIPL